jgi:hypothetical protein
MSYSIQQEKRVTIQTYQPNVQSLLALLEEHAKNTDTQPVEWAVDIEKQHVDVLNPMNPSAKWRWVITLTRSIK